MILACTLLEPIGYSLNIRNSYSFEPPVDVCRWWESKRNIRAWIVGSRLRRISNGVDDVKRRKLSLTNSGNDRSSGSCDDIVSFGGDDDNEWVERETNDVDVRWCPLDKDLYG